MFSRQILDFLSELKENNNREWFQANKEKYESARLCFEDFVNVMIPRITKFDPKISNITAKDCMFRIYKDVRFSKDKLPYKTNFGAFMARGGRKGPFAGYYLHIEPGASLLAGGIYMPMPEVLKAVRNEIFENTDEFLAIINNKLFKKYFSEIDGEKLKSAPRDYPKEFPFIDLLKYKSYCTVYMLSDNDLLKSSFQDDALKIFAAMLPFNNYFNKIIAELFSY